MAIFVAQNTKLKKILKIARNFLIVLVSMVLLVGLLLQLTPVQNYLAGQAVAYFSKKFQTQIGLKYLHVTFFNSLVLEDVYLLDRNQDTLLQAGKVQLRITDWFFLRPDPLVSYIGLKDAQVNLQRSKENGVWNYQFIIDAFGGTQPKTQEKQGDLQMDLRRLVLQNVQFRMADAWVGTDMSGSVNDLELKADRIHFTEKIIAINSLKGDGLTFGLTEYTGGRPDSLAPKRGRVPDVDTTPFNKGLWRLTAKEVALDNSRFFLEYLESTAPEGEFDEEHLNITDIGIRMQQVRIEGDTILAHIRHLQAKERCGLEIRNMEADVKVSPNISECSNLFLQTRYSTLRHYYAMRYDRFPDFLDYINKVKMEGRLDQAEIGLQDIIYFAPALERFHHVSVQVSGQGGGTVSKLRAKDLDIFDGMSRLTGTLAMEGLPDIERTFIDFQDGILQTSGPAAFLYFPTLKQSSTVNLAALHAVDFKGNFTGYIRDFVAYGHFNTNLGQLDADVHLKLPAHATPTYAGALQAQEFDVGTLLNQSLLGLATFKAEVEGASFEPEKASASLEGRIERLDLKDYPYRDLEISGILSNKQFNGLLKAQDPNANFDFDGKVDFSGAEPVFNFLATVRNLDAHALHFTQRGLVANGRLQLDFEGDQIDDFIGYAHVYDLNILRDSLLIALDTVQLRSTVSPEGEKQILLTTNELEARVNGHFTLVDLPASIQLYLSYYLPNYITPPSFQHINQQLQFEVQVGDPTDLLNLFGRPVGMSANARLSGMMDMGRQQLSLEGVIPSIQYGNFVFDDVHLKGDGTYQGLDIEVAANGISNGQREMVSLVQFQTHLYQDTAQFQLFTTTPTSLGKAEVKGVAYAEQDSFFVRLHPSEFYLNAARWEIPEGNSTVFAPDFVAIDRLAIRSGQQEVLINVPPDKSIGNAAIVRVNNLDIAPLNGFLNADFMQLGGKLDGSIELKDIMTDFFAGFNLTASKVQLNKEDVGEVRLAGTYQGRQKMITFNSPSGIFYQDAKAELYGKVSFDRESEDAIHASVLFDKARAAWISPLLAGYVSQISGGIDGMVTLKGSTAKPKLSGLITLRDVGFRPDIIGAHYTIPQGVVNVEPGKFDLGQMKIRDDKGQEGILSGTVQHADLSAFQLRVNLTSDQIEVLNLREYENINFYGRADASVNMRVTGPWENLNMTIFATPAKDAQLFIPIASDSDLGAYDYISFKEYGTVEEQGRAVGRNKFNLRLDVVATPDLEATIILDPATGDQIWAKGSGNVILEIPADGDIRMNGNYIIEEGKYNFAFKQLQILNYRRQFNINPGSVIKWNGNIADADLDVTAYAQVKARLYDLISNEVNSISLSDAEKQDAQLPQFVNVTLTMKGSLDNPEMSFKLGLAESRSMGTYAYQKLQRINSDDRELLNQVASLLLLEQFVPPEGIMNVALSSGTINNMSELISSAASSQVTNLANKILGMEDLYIGLKYKNYNLNDRDPTNPFTMNRNEAGINLRKNFFNDRLVVEVGGVYDWGRLSAQSDYITNFAGDFRVQYLLTEDGRIRFNVFRTSNYDAIYLQNIGRQGVGLSYRKSFNTLSDIFRRSPVLHLGRKPEIAPQQQADTSQRTIPVSAISAEAI